jgi:hypothetical protein
MDTKKANKRDNKEKFGSRKIKKRKGERRAYEQGKSKKLASLKRL